MSEIASPELESRGQHTGRKLAGRYALSERLGEGATAEVYAASDAQLEVERAVKLLSGGGAVRERLRERLKAEAKGMARLEHPNILPVYDVGADGPLDFVVMKLARGGSLQDRLDRAGPLPPEQACGCIVQLLSALDAAHEAGIVHRDIKPQNILTDGTGQILLSDFGIALWQQKRATQTGVAMGSLPYMAPEQRLDASRVGPGADLFSVGATLYHLLTASNPVDLFASPEHSPRWEGVPHALRPFIRKATSYRVEDRFPSAAVMAQALLSAMPEVVSAIWEPGTDHSFGEASWHGATSTAVGLLLGEEPTPALIDSWIGSMEPPMTTIPPEVVDRSSPLLPIGGVGLLLVVGLAMLFAWPEPALEEVTEPVAAETVEPISEPPVEPAAVPVAVTESVPVAALEPEEEPVAVIKAPPVLPAPAVSAPEAPTLPAPDRVQPAIHGRWVGDINGIPKSVWIQASGGTIWSLWRSETGGDPAPTVSVGAFDPQSGRLTLQEQDGVERQGRYEFELTPDGDLQGRRWESASGRQFFTVVLQREVR
jgi:serine/threonine protein kinase